MVSTKYSAVYLVNSRSMTFFLSCQASYAKNKEVILFNNTAMGDWIKIINMAFTCYSL